MGELYQLQASSPATSRVHQKLARDFKEPAHLSKRVMNVIPGVVVYLCLWFHLTVHAWIGGWSDALIFDMELI